tara:strand:+ start:8804 stop:8995 length:192 start_codon:yes stop_codon:yes gene_type:complete
MLGAGLMNIDILNKMILQLELRLPELDNQSITQELEAIRAQINDGFADVEKEKGKDSTYKVIT